jgi:hypothetical protein
LFYDIFCNLGVHYLADWKGNDENCPPELRKKIANLVQPFLTFPLAWLQFYSSHNTHLLINNYVYQQPSEEKEEEKEEEEEEEEEGSSHTEQCNFPSAAATPLPNAHTRSDSVRASAPLQRSLSMNQEHLSDNRAPCKLHRALSEEISHQQHSCADNHTVAEPAEVMDIDLALDNHEKFLTDWKYLFFVWLSLVDDGSELIGFVHSSDAAGGLWNIGKSYDESHYPSVEWETPPPTDFQLDRFVMDTYVSFSFLNTMYECVSHAEEDVEDNELNSVSRKHVDFGVLFGRDRHHRRDVVLTTPTRRLLLQEVSIRFVNIFFSWSSAVQALLPPVSVLLPRDDTKCGGRCVGNSPHALDSDFHIPGKTVQSKNETELLSRIETCCTILQEEDVFLWIGYIFTLRDTLRKMNIQFLSVISHGANDGTAGLSPDSSFPATDNNSYVSHNSIGNSKKHNSANQKSKIYAVSDSGVIKVHNGLIVCHEWCFDIIVNMKKTQLYLQRSNDGNNLFALVEQKITTLVKHFFEKLFHYMYDFNCKEYFVLLDSSVQEFVKTFTKLSLEMAALEPLCDGSDVNIETVQQFSVEWSKRFAEVVNCDPNNLQNDRGEDTAHHSVVAAEDHSSPPLTPVLVPDTTQDANKAKESKALQQKPYPTSMIDDLIGGDDELNFSGSLTALSTQLGEITKGIEVEVNDHSEKEDVLVNDNEFEYDAVPPSPTLTLGKRPHSPPPEGYIFTHDNIIVNNANAVATSASSPPDAISSIHKKHKSNNLDATIEEEKKKSREEEKEDEDDEAVVQATTPSPSPAGTSISLLRESAALLQQADSLLASSVHLRSRWSERPGCVGSWTGAGERREARQLLGAVTLRTLEFMQKLVKLQQAVEEE